MRNEQLLEEIRQLFDSFDKELDELSNKVSFLQGTVLEMQRHNGRVIKVLAGVITTLLGIIAWLVAP